MYRRTQGISPILQDFVPYRGRSPQRYIKVPQKNVNRISISPIINQPHFSCSHLILPLYKGEPNIKIKYHVSHWDRYSAVLRRYLSALYCIDFFDQNRSCSQFIVSHQDRHHLKTVPFPRFRANDQKNPEVYEVGVGRW